MTRVFICGEGLDGVLAGLSGTALTGLDRAAITSLMSDAVEQAMAAPVDLLKGQASLQFAFIARPGDETDRTTLEWALADLDSAFSSHSPACCQADIVLLLPALFGDVAPNKDGSTAAFVERIAGTSSIHASITYANVWLVDGVSERGLGYRIAEVGPVLAEFLTGGYIEKLGTTSNLLSFGARGIVFPRDAILEHLRDRYALAVLDREPWLCGQAILQKASIAQKCADFVRESMRPIIDKIDRDPKGQPLVPLLTMPQIEAEQSMGVIRDALRRPIDEALAKDFPRIQQSIAENRVGVESALVASAHARTSDFINQEPNRVIAAMAFIDVLKTGTSDLVTGDYIETGQARTLRDVIKPAILFFDSVSGFDSKVRDVIATLGETVAAKADWMSKLAQDEARLVSEGADPGSPEVAALRQQIADGSAQLEQQTREYEEGRATIRVQDMRVEGSDNRERFQRDVAAAIEVRVTEADGRMVKAKAEVENVDAEIAAEEEKLRQYLWGLASKLIVLLVALIGVWGLGILVMPLIFGAVPVVGPLLFGFIGTVAAAMFTKWYAIPAIVGFIAAAILGLRTYFAMRTRLDQLTTKRESILALFRLAAHDYWNACLARFTTRCDFARYFGAFDAERKVAESLLARRESLAAFLDGLRAYREGLLSKVAGFELPSTSTRLCIVDTAYVNGLLEDRREQIASLSAKFLGQWPLSVYEVAYESSADFVKLETDLALQCGEELFVTFADTTVADVFRESEVTGPALIEDLALFIPVSLRGVEGWQGDREFLVRGPDAELLASAFAGSGAKMIVTPEDYENIFAIVVADSIRLQDIVSLAAPAKT